MSYSRDIMDVTHFVFSTGNVILRRSSKNMQIEASYANRLYKIDNEIVTFTL